MVIQKDIEKQWEHELKMLVSSSNDDLVINPLLEYYIEIWLKKKRTSLRMNTWYTYRQYADNYIIPFFKDIHVNELNTRLVQQFVDYYLDCGHKVSSYKKVNVVLAGAIRCAIQDGVINVNYADKDHIDLPREESFEGDYYTVEEIGLLLQAVEAAGEPMKSAIILALCYGLRRSEIIGLRWCDIDFNNRTMTISHTYVQDGSLVLDEDHTKSRASNRTIALIESTIPYLESLKQRYDSLEKKTDKVVMWDDGRQVRPDYITSKLVKLQDEYSLRHIRLHDLRHTAASLLANESDVSLLQVQQFMGHSDVRMTRHYSHAFDETNRETASKMNNVLSGIGSFNDLCSEACSESA